MSSTLQVWKRCVWILALSWTIAGCDAQSSPESPTAGPSSNTTAGSTPGAPTGDTITIASFNIQVFGTSKLAKPEVMDILAKVVRRFDIVAIQEVRSKDDHIVPQFVELINAEGANYEFVIGPRLGRTSSKEQYAIIYNAARIAFTPGSAYTVPDPSDLFQREPLVANFRVQGLPAGQGFSFSLVDIHTEPDEAANEVDALAEVFVGVQRNGSGEDDVIVLGDLNSDEYHLGRLGRLPNIAHAITGQQTNTRGTHMYDNLVFDPVATNEYTGRAGVLNLVAEYGLTQELALEVSDHFPVWAVFSVYEGGGAGPLAGRPTQLR